MDYLLKSSAIIFIFYACYKLFLQRDTFFESNRWFLLSGLIIASCIPLIVIPIYIEYTPIQFTDFTTTHFSENITSIQEQPINYQQVITWTYLSGLLIFIGKLTIELVSLKRILNTDYIQSSGNIKLIETKKQVAPFSFFNYIVYNPKQFSETELQHVINHEKAHTRQLHSIDTVIAQIACVLLWFNPFVWLYKRALQQNLEFIADQKAQYVSPCEKSYQTVLLKTSIKNHPLVFTNNFYTSLIKKRIIMLHKSKSKKLNQLKLIVVLPLLALFIMSFNTEDIYVDISTNENKSSNQVYNSEEVIEIIITKKTSDANLESIKKELQSKGITFKYSDIKRNSDGEITAISAEFKSDKNATNYNISGNDGIKSFQFKSSKDTFSVGTIDQENYTFEYETSDGTKAKNNSNGTNVYVFESNEDEGEDLNDEDEDEEKRNGKTKLMIKSTDDSEPVIYEQVNSQTWISNGGTKTKINASENGKTKIFISKSDEPIFILNGKKVEKSLFEDVDSEDIQSVFVLKGEKAIEKYGNDGKNGVIIMTKKGSKNLFSESEDTVITKSNSFTFETDGDELLYILNGKIITKDKLNEINPNEIQNVEVLKDKSAVKSYGAKGENGVIIINTKGSNKSHLFSKGNNNTVIEVEEEGPWKIETAVTSVQYIDDDNDTDIIEFIIVKKSSDAFLESQKSNLKKLGIDAKFTKVRRNKAGEITSIKISLDDNQGRKSIASWKEKEQAIPDIVLGKSTDDKLYIRAIGN